MSATLTPSSATLQFQARPRARAHAYAHARACHCDLWDLSRPALDSFAPSL
jgi:hypothetical protein